MDIFISDPTNKDFELFGYTDEQDDDCLYGKLNREIQHQTFEGKETDTAKVEVNNESDTIKVDVKKTPKKLTIKDGSSLKEFDGSEDVEISIMSSAGFATQQELNEEIYNRKNADDKLQSNINNLESSIPSIIDAKLATKNFVEDPDYIHTDNNFTDEDKTELDTLHEMRINDEFGKVDDVKVNDKSIVTNKIAEISLSSDISNNSPDIFASTEITHKINENKVDKTDIVNELGDNLDKIISQKIVTDNINNINNRLLNNIKDGKNNSLIGNDIQSNIIKTDGYIDSQGVWQEISGTPILVSNINANIELDGYYVIPKSLIENGAFGYALYQFLEGAIGTPIKNYIGKVSTLVSRWVTNTYNYNSANMNALGSNNLVSGEGSLVVGNNNKNAGYNSLISGKNNTSNAGESIVSGLNNTNLGGSSAVFGVSNNVNDNQGLATGYHNKISTGSLYSTVTGIGNVTKGLANFVAGDYNYTGSDYNVAIGSQNIVGGNITYNNIPITEIQDYSSSSQYIIGSIVKLNGYVYKALVNNPSRPELTSDEWEIIKPVTTKDNSINSFSGGSKNTINSSNSFAYGTGLIANKGNQTVLGKYNNTNINASLIIGNGSDDDSRENIFEVLNNGQINIKDRINMSVGNKTAVLRNTTSGDFVISGEGGVAIRPSGTGVTTGSIIFRPSFIGPQSRNVDLGSLSVPFRNLYLQNNLILNNKTYSNENFVSDEDRTNWNNKANASYVDEKINDINSKIPNQASSTNQLADKDFVNSSINNIAAFYITKNANGDPFENYNELITTTTYYSGGEVRIPTRNDYCIVRVDENHDNATTRYIYGNQWEFQYIVNETALTAEQLAALNSGATKEIIDSISNKLDKITSTSALNRVYVVNYDGTQGNLPIAQGIDYESTIVQRTSDKKIKAETPTDSDDVKMVVNKEYINNVIIPMLPRAIS